MLDLKNYRLELTAERKRSLITERMNRTEEHNFHKLFLLAMILMTGSKPTTNENIFLSYHNSPIYFRVLNIKVEFGWNFVH